MGAESKEGLDKKATYKQKAVIVTVALAFIVISFLGYIYWERFEGILTNRDKLNKLRAKRVELVQENADLRQRLTRKNDLSYIKKLAKEKLGFVEKESKN